MDRDEMRKHILYRYNQAVRYTQGWHQHIEEWRQLYDFNHYDGEEKPLPGETRFADPTYTNTVDLAVGIFQGNRMSWKSVGLNPSSKEAKDTSTVEKYLTATLDSNSRRREYDIVYETNMQFTRDGGSVLYCVWDPDLAYESMREIDTVVDETKVEKVEAYDEIPIHIEVIDPMQMFLLPGGPGRWLCMIRGVSMTLYEAELKIGHPLESYSNMDMDEKFATMVDFLDYWEMADKEHATFNKAEDEEGETDRDDTGRRWYVQHAVMVGEEIVTPLHVMSKYLEFPYTVGFYKPTNRIDAAGWQSIMSPLQPVVSLLERSVNRRTRQIDVLSSLPLVARTASGKGVTVDRSIATVVNLRTDDRLEFPTFPGSAPDVDKQIALLQARVQQSGFPEIMYGSGSDTESGYALSQLSDQGRIRLNQPLNHLMKFWSWVGRKIIDITIAHADGKKIFTYGLLGTSQFSGFVDVDVLGGYKIECRIKPEFPNERTRNHAMASQVKGLLSGNTIRENYLDVDQSSDEEQRIQIEQALNHPIMQQYLLLSNLMEMAKVDKDPAAAKAVQVLLASMASSMGGDAAGQTQDPNAPDPAGLTGTQSQNGEAPRQATSTEAPGQSAEDIQNRMANTAPKLRGGQ